MRSAIKARGVGSLTSGQGDDVFHVDNAGDVVTENVSEGVDEIRSSISLILSGNVENLILLGAA